MLINYVQPDPDELFKVLPPPPYRDTRPEWWYGCRGTTRTCNKSRCRSARSGRRSTKNTWRGYASTPRATSPVLPPQTLSIALGGSNRCGSMGGCSRGREEAGKGCGGGAAAAERGTGKAETGDSGRAEAGSLQLVPCQGTHTGNPLVWLLQIGDSKWRFAKKYRRKLGRSDGQPTTWLHRPPR